MNSIQNCSFQIEQQGDETLIHYSFPVSYDVGAIVLRAMQQAHYSRLDQWPFQVALHQSNSASSLILLARLPNSEAKEAQLDLLRSYLASQANTILSV